MDYASENQDFYNEIILNWNKNKKITFYRPDYKFMTLPDRAMCQSVQVFLKLIGKKFETEIANNCEFMSSKGFPFIVVDDECIHAGFENIVNYFGIDIKNNVKNIEAESTKSLFNCLYNLELALCWFDEDNFRLTKKTFDIYPKPLNYILCFLKKRSIKNILKQRLNQDFLSASNPIHNIIEELEITLNAIDSYVSNNTYVVRNDFHALIYGHIDAILNTELTSSELVDIINNCKNLYVIYEKVLNQLKSDFFY